MASNREEALAELAALGLPATQVCNEPLPGIGYDWVCHQTQRGEGEERILRTLEWSQGYNWRCYFAAGNADEQRMVDNCATAAEAPRKGTDAFLVKVQTVLRIAQKRRRNLVILQREVPR